MAVEPNPRQVGVGQRDLVFLSYSHDDAEWAQALTVILAPLTRSKRLRVWVDVASIRAGDAWHPEIDRAIAHSQVAVLLVSARFVASDFIMETELPALVAQGVRLVPVLIGDCLWKHVPELARVQWLHDPGRDGAMSLVADQIGERDRRLVQICDRLIELLPEPATVPPSPQPARTEASVVAAIPDGAKPGELFGVPQLPPGYVAREEMAGLIAAVVEDGAVGLTGTVSAVGLHGQGGIGKSVLAAALAHDDQIRSRFPDGVYWVTVGERADVLGVQLGLLAQLGVTGAVPRTSAEARDLLVEVLAERRVLLVVDDVWSDAAAVAFRVSGPQGRVLFTTRDPQILTAAGARTHPVEVLSPAAARGLAAAILDLSPDEIPLAAQAAFVEVGQVALGVALLAAAVRGGGSWDEVTAALRRDTGIYGDHPYANTFKAMAITVGHLPTDLRTALLGLAVFPPDTQIPVEAIVRYWHRTRAYTAEQTLRDLELLATANVVHLDRASDSHPRSGPVGATVGFHDLQHDYLLLHAGKPVLLHAALLEAYQGIIPTGDGRSMNLHHPAGQGATGPREWWQLPPDEPYIWEHLIEHLRGAGHRRELLETVTDPAYLVRRIAIAGPHAAEADLACAAALLPDHALIVWWQGWISRHLHYLSPDEAAQGPAEDPAENGVALAPTMQAWLIADQARPPEIDPAQLAPLHPRPHLSMRWGLISPDAALVRVLSGHTAGVRSVAWSPDGTRLATGSGHDKLVRLWDPVTGHTTTLTGQSGGVMVVAWSPDGTRLATGDDGQVWLWDPVTGHTTATLTGHTGWVKVMAWSPDGTRLATATGDDGQVRLWDPVTGHTTAILTGHTGRVEAMAWSPDGTRLATVAGNGQVRLWDPITGHTTTTTLPRAVRAAAWSPDGTRLAAIANGYQEVWLCDPVTGYTTTLAGPIGWATVVVWSPDGTRLVTAGGNEQVRLWDPITRRTTTTLAGPIGWVDVVAWSPEGTRLATGGGEDGLVRLWDPVTGHATATLTGHTDRVGAAAWSPDGTRLATGGHDRLVRLWNPTRHITTVTGHAHSVAGMAWSPDGARLATGGRDGVVRLWDSVTGHASATLTGHSGWVTVVAWSPDGTRLAAAANKNKMVLLWDPVTRRITATLAGHSGWVEAMAWSPDGTRLATAGDDKLVRLWDPVTRHTTATLAGHASYVGEVCWSPDGTRLATAGGDDGQVRLWDPVTGHTTATLAGHSGWVRARVLAWSPDGTRLATAGDDDGQVRLWDPVTGHTTTLPGHTGGMPAVAWSPDGTRLATAGDDGTIRVTRLGRDARSIYLHVEPIIHVDWSSGGIAVGGSWGIAALDLLVD